ncbi:MULTISPECIES: DUF6119 family protein [Croceibacter]|uniref:DUF6119 family protein n=1 Tax=Croceibacter TaxID=216431 RepID=UPI000C497DC9|nr:MULTISPECIES: DUF6119 family protein [Croceibacter]MBG25664.1 hypothetical protein [Croceibacter sp.]|tara:strand:+ start:15592 stop:17364 length:1773 start_codon:yes stop_codon:yes gene_type:complete
MNQKFFDSKEFSEIKIFQINRDFYELKNIGGAEKTINFIVDKHRELVDDLKSIGVKIPKTNFDEVDYYSYVYNETLKDSYWKNYLPSTIAQNHNFDVLKISFVLFASIKGDIFAIVGGGGIRVIKRFMNNRFGLEFYEYLTIPKDDIVVSLTARGISGRVAQQSGIYRNGRTLLDSLKFTEIPTKLNLVLREDLKNTVFDFVGFSNDTIYTEVGSYFLIKHAIKFKSLHQIFKKINEIHRKHKPTSISTFTKVQDPTLVEDEFQKILLSEVRNDMLNMLGPNRTANPYKFDIDFIHPSKIQDFYECNRYELKTKGQRTPFFETTDRNLLYKEGLKHLFDNTNDQFEFSKMILGMRVYGYRDKTRKTHAMFLQHITCEIKYNGKPVFQIDSTWYKVKNDFINSINDRCINLIDKNILRSNFLNVSWDSTIADEGAYNLKYNNLKDYYVFDKMLPDNIEFCDIMYEDSNTIYLVHVKDGFDAKIRDVANQITISANRFWNDFNSGSSSYLSSIVDSYNKKNANKIDKKTFLNKFNVNKEVVYVMAYKSLRGKLSTKDKIEKSKSNIAKYSLIQCVQDMSSLYPIKIFDIADV